MARSTHIGGIRVDLTAGTAAFVRDINKAGLTIGSFAKMATRSADAAVSGMARLALAPLRVATSFKSMAATVGGVLALRQVGRMIGQTVERLDELGERARQLGLSAEEYSTIEYAAKRANVEQDALNNALKLGAKNLGELLLTGKGGAATAFQSLGIQVRDAAGGLKSMGTLIEEIGDAFARGGWSQPERLKALADIFGKQGFAIERLLAGGKFKEYRQELERLGGVVSGDQVKQAQLMSDAIDRMGVAWKGLKAQLVTGGASTMTGILNGSARSLADIRLAVMGLGGTAGKQGEVELVALKSKAINLGRVATTEIFRFAALSAWDFADLLRKSFAPRVVDDFAVALQDLVPGSLKSAPYQLRQLNKELQQTQAMLEAVELANRGAKLSFDQESNAILGLQRGGFDALRKRKEAIYDEMRAIGQAQQGVQKMLDAEKNVAISGFLEKTGTNWAAMAKAVGAASTELDNAADAYRAFFKAGDQPAAKATVQQKFLAEQFTRLLKLMREGGAAAFDFGQDFYDALTRPSKQIIYFSEVMTDAVRGFAADAGRSFADLVVDGKASFADLAKGWAKTLISMASQYLIFKPLFDILGGKLGEFVSSKPSINVPTNVPITSAKGNVFLNNQLVKFAKGGGFQGLIDSTMIFPLRGGRIGMAGEAGTEYAVKPVRLPNGELGVRSTGGVNVTIIDQRSGGARPEVQERRGPDGRTELVVWLRDEVRRMVGDGSLDRTMGAVYGVRRVGATR